MLLSPYSLFGSVKPRKSLIKIETLIEKQVRMVMFKMVLIHFKFLGSLANFAGGQFSKLNIDSNTPITILSCIQALTKEFGRELTERILDDRSIKPRVKTLILKNDVEIRALENLDTEMNEKDELTFIPFTHGG